MDLNTEPSYKAFIDNNFINVPLKISFMGFLVFFRVSTLQVQICLAWICATSTLRWPI